MQPLALYSFRLAGLPWFLIQKKDESIMHSDVIVVPERSTFSSPTDPPVTDFHDQPSASPSIYLCLDHSLGLGYLTSLRSEAQIVEHTLI